MPASSDTPARPAVAGSFDPHATVTAPPPPPDAPFAHRFDQAVHLTALGDGRLRGHTDEAYWNMVGPYGGIVASVVMQALMLRDDRIGDPLALTINYAGALNEGEF